MPASASFDSSREHRIGWKPKPRLKLGAAFSLSECELTSVASRSSTISLGAAPRRQACARARRRASRIRFKSFLFIAVITRHAVGIEATSPKTSGWSRRTCPLSCPELRWRLGATAADRPRVNPKPSLRPRTARLPTWLAMPSPSLVTTNLCGRLLRRLLLFTCEVLSLNECWDVEHPQYLNSGEHFFSRLVAPVARAY